MYQPYFGLKDNLERTFHFSNYCPQALKLHPTVALSQHFTDDTQRRIVYSIKPEPSETLQCNNQQTEASTPILVAYIMTVSKL